MKMCAHGGPVSCNMGCYAKGGLVKMNIADMIMKKRKANQEDSYNDISMSDSDFDMVEHPEWESLKGDDADVEMAANDEEDAKLKRKSLIGKILMSR